MCYLEESFFEISQPNDILEFFGKENRVNFEIKIKVLSNEDIETRSTSAESLSLYHQPIKLDQLNVISSLELVNATISESECLLIANNSNLSQLKHLNLACNPIGGPGLKNLLKSKYLIKIQKLVLYDCGINRGIFDFCKFSEM